MKSKKLPKRCKFYAACGQAATCWKWHSYLKQWLPVCNRCAAANEWLSLSPEQPCKAQEAAAALAKSHALDEAASPGDTYQDPVWGKVSVPKDE